MNNVNRTSQFLLLISLTLLLGACGWQLRGFNQGSLPVELALQTQDPYAPLARQLQQTLVRRGVAVSATAPVKLWLDAEVQEKRTVAVTTIGSAAQYELKLEVAYQFLSHPEDPLLPITLVTQRTFDFIPGSNLAKVEEEQTLLREMRQELINRILAQAPKAKAEQASSESDSASSSPLIVPPEEAFKHRLEGGQ